MKVAVIGGGLSGLSAAWRLSQESNIEVVLYEALPTPGFANASFNLSSGVDVDVPQRYFVADYYPVLSSFYRHLNIESVPVSSPTSFLNLASPERAYFAYNNLVLFGGRLSIPWINPLRLLDKETRDILWDVFRFSRVCRNDLLSNSPLLFGQTTSQPEQPSNSSRPATTREYMLARGFSASFRDKLLGPLFAVVCTCTVEEALNYPATQVIEWFLSTAPKSHRFRTSHQRVAGGIRRLVPLLLEKVVEVQCNTSVTGVQPRKDDDGSEYVELEETNADGTSTVRRFDHVVLAAQPDASLRMLKSPTALHTQILGCFSTSNSCVTLHRDPIVMPADRSQWNSMNFFLSTDGKECQATLWQNSVQDLPASEGQVFQTWNPLVKIDPALIISTSWFDRPVLTPETVRQVKNIDQIQGVGRMWFCGSYAHLGIPLLESAVSSGFDVAGRITKTTLPFPTPSREITAHLSRKPSGLFLLLIALILFVVLRIIF